MEAVFLIALTLVLVLAGCGATFAIAGLLSPAICEQAQHNGRFAGLGSHASKSGGDSGKRIRVPRFATGYAALQFH